MNKYLFGILTLLVAESVYAGITADQKYILNEQSGAGPQRVRLGTLVDQPASLSVVWDSSTGNMGSSTLRTGSPTPVTFGAHDLGVMIPKKSLILRSWVEVTKPWTNVGPGVSPTLQFYCSTVTQGLTTVNLNSATNYDKASASGGDLLALTAQNTLATFQRNDSTEDCRVVAKVGGQNRVDGKITLFVEYMQIR